MGEEAILGHALVALDGLARGGGGGGGGGGSVQRCQFLILIDGSCFRFPVAFNAHCVGTVSAS